MLLLFFIKFVAFPSRKDSIFSTVDKSSITASASGSLGLYYDDKCHITYPNQTLVSDERKDWCSNIKNESGNPWISYSIKNKKMKVNGFSIRNGCCRRAYCCCTEDGKIVDSSSLYRCCCALYSFDLQGSNDNKTWETIHSVEKRNEFIYCKYYTYEFEKTQPYKYLRILQKEEYPGCPFCMVINEIDFYGEVVDSLFEVEDYENDESVSIIGKVRKGE